MTKRSDISEKGAILQRDGETYALTPRIPCGVIEDFDLLRRVADAAERYGAKSIKVTSSQRLAVIGIREDDIDAFWQDVGMSPGLAFGLCVRSIKACPGTTYCRLGQQDSLGLGLKIEDRYVNQPTPSKLKISVSGCPLDCAEAHIRDIGIVGTKKGFTVEIGGCGGPSPEIGVPLADGLTFEQAEELVGKIIRIYRELGRKQRLGKVLKKVGIEAFQRAATQPDPS